VLQLTACEGLASPCAKPESPESWPYKQPSSSALGRVIAAGRTNSGTEALSRPRSRLDIRLDKPGRIDRSFASEAGDCASTSSSITLGPPMTRVCMPSRERIEADVIQNPALSRWAESAGHDISLAADDTYESMLEILGAGYGNAPASHESCG